MADLIDRTKAIKAIEDMQDCYNGFSSTFDKAQIIEVLEEVPTAEPQWVSCTAKFFLPINGTVIVCDSDKYVTVGYLNIIGEWYDMCGNRLKNVCAWMPLPQPYKGD